MTEPMMQAVQIHDYGGPGALVLEEAPRPEPQKGQVLIRLRAAGVNPVDSGMRSGAYKQFMQLQLPWTPGLEGAGVVEAVGPDASVFRPGQEVFGLVTGGYAEFAVANEKEIQPKPSNLTMEQAASVAMGVLTAWGAVIETANVETGQAVLIQGAAGGVGSYATQLAHWKGAYVMGTARAENAPFVRSIGADLAIDYQASPFEEVVKDVDVVIDTVGGEVIDRSWLVLRPGGLLVTVAGGVSPEAGQAFGVRAATARRAGAENLAQIATMLQTKALVPTVRAVFPLARARQAMELSETHHGRGRIILSIA